MRQLIVIILIITLFSCKEEKPVNYAVIAGKIQNTKSKKISVKNYDTYSYVKDKEVIKEITLAQDGSFSDTIFNPDQHYLFDEGENSALLYLQNGYNITLNADSKNFDKSLTYSGLGSGANNYLALKEVLRKPFNGHYKLEEVDYLKVKDSIKKVKFEVLTTIKDTDKEFISSEELDAKYEHLYALLNYQGWHRAFIKDPTFTVSETYPQELGKVDFDNDEYYKKSSYYRSLAIESIIKKAKKVEKEKEIPFKKAFMSVIETGGVKSTLRREYYIDATSSYFDVTKPEFSKEVYEWILKYANDENTKAKATKRYQKAMALAKGSPSPKFENYENHTGGTASLDDFKGKYVYIDLWATWCGPCLAEVPYLEKLEEQYHDANIIFVSISTDKKKDYDKWRKMVTDKQMGGIQLLADNSSYSKFYQDYGIKAIPRFILIDPEGNIVSANAPRPSDPKLIELFKKEEI